VAGSSAPTPAAWAYSTVSTFGVRYMPPLPDLTTLQSVEALVEGSDMSVIREGILVLHSHRVTDIYGNDRESHDARICLVTSGGQKETV
jgi:hypothetical protein